MDYLQKLYHQACIDELLSLKPGNVHIFADGHEMTTDNFMQSARLSATWITHSQLNLGQRILQAIQAVYLNLSCNTNLGIVLLCAPILLAEQKQLTIQQVLEKVNLEEAQLIYQAIRLAAPAGLGTTQYDVNFSPEVSLLQAMQFCQTRDNIARQYTNAFDDIFGFGLTIYNSHQTRGINQAWLLTIVYLEFLSHFLDSHIMRKFGDKIALNIQAEAQFHFHEIISKDNPKTYQRPLLEWDLSLKKRGINPGTSADLTVATHLAFLVQSKKGFS